MNRHPIQGIFPPDAQFSWCVLQIHHPTDPHKPATEVSESELDTPQLTYIAIETTTSDKPHVLTIV